MVNFLAYLIAVWILKLKPMSSSSTERSECKVSFRPYIPKSILYDKKLKRCVKKLCIQAVASHEIQSDLSEGVTLLRETLTKAAIFFAIYILNAVPKTQRASYPH